MILRMSEYPLEWGPLLGSPISPSPGTISLPVTMPSRSTTPTQNPARS